MRIVLALGGNALLRRGQALSWENQIENVKAAAAQIAKVATEHELVLCHGNGPQVGLQALQAAAYTEVDPYPLDVLCAHTQAQIGYLLESELRPLLGEKPLATLMTQVEVDADDPAFGHPTKFIGPVYSHSEAHELATKYDWDIAPDGSYWRRVVPSPRPLRIVELEAIKALLSAQMLVICAGGGGVPMVASSATQTLKGVEAIIDKDLCSSLLARNLQADLFIIATDVEGVYLDWQTPQQRLLDKATVKELQAVDFASGSMGPKVAAACEFAANGQGKAVIGALSDIARLISGEAGTTVSA